jgi:hypothetical protein
LPLYHRPQHGSTPTKRIDVVPTPWEMPPALGLGAVHCGGEHYAPLHTAFIVTDKTPQIWLLPMTIAAFHHFPSPFQHAETTVKGSEMGYH